MTKSLDNVLRTMNEYLKDMFDIFGGSSTEYSRALQQVKAALPDNVLNQVTRSGLHYAGAAPTQPLQFSRGKAAQSVLTNFQGDLDKLRAEQRQTGTAKVQQQDYILEAKIDKKPATREEIKKRAIERYEFNNLVNDWYEDIMNDNLIDDATKASLKDKYSNIRSDYDDPTFRRGLKEAAENAIAEAELKRSAIRAAEAVGTPFEIKPETLLKGR